MSDAPWHQWFVAALCCGAGVHGGLAVIHAVDGEPARSMAFALAATAASAALAGVGRGVRHATTAVMFALLGPAFAWFVSLSVTLPVVGTGQVDALAVGTFAIEVTGAAAVMAVRGRAIPPPRAVPWGLCALVAAFSFQLAFAVPTSHVHVHGGHHAAH